MRVHINACTMVKKTLGDTDLQIQLVGSHSFMRGLFSGYKMGNQSLVTFKLFINILCHFLLL